MARGWESAQAKILRALKQREPLEDCIAEYSSRKPYRIIAQPNGIPTLETIEHPPIELSVIAGEILYQLRSALDHMFFDLVERNWIGPMPDKVAERLQFPLCLNPPGDATKVPPIPRGYFGQGTIPDCIPEAAFALIESLQPYYGAHRGHKLLRMLRLFSNIDKHRRLNATVAAIHRRNVVTGPSGISSSLLIPWLTSGTELYEPLHFVDIDKNAMEVKDEYTIAVAFHEPEFGPFQTAPIEEVMYNLPTLVFRISLFLREFLQ